MQESICGDVTTERDTVHTVSHSFSRFPNENTEHIIDLSPPSERHFAPVLMHIMFRVMNIELKEDYSSDSGITRIY